MQRIAFRRLPACLFGTAAAALFAVATAGAQPHAGSAPVTVVNTPANPVPVSGTIGLNGTVTVEETFAPGRAAKRYGPIEVQLTGNFVGQELVPPVAAGRRFIVTNLHAVGFSLISPTPLTSGACTLQLRQGTTYTPFLLLPGTHSGPGIAINQPTFLPVEATDGLYVLCAGAAADGSTPSQAFRVTASGYFVPAVP